MAGASHEHKLNPIPHHAFWIPVFPLLYRKNGKSYVVSNSKTLQRYVSGEIFYLVFQAIRSKEFIFDSEFCQKQYFSGKGRTSNDIFAELVIYTGRAMHEFEDMMVRHELFEIYLRRQDESIGKLGELFPPPPPINKDTNSPCKILVFDRQVIWKSLLCTKLSRNLSKSELLRDSDKNSDHLYLI